MRKLKNKLSQHFKSAPDNCSTNIDSNNIESIALELLTNTANLNTFTRDQLKMLGTYISVMIEANEADTKKLCLDRDNLIAELPNFTHTKCVINNDEANNGIVFENSPQNLEFSFKPKDHIDLLQQLGFTDTENGIKVAGNRGYFLTGFGVRLNQAIISYALGKIFDFIEFN